MLEDQEHHLKFMRIALGLADAAAQVGEVPVGALIVRGDTIISSGINLRETNQQPAAHAEMIAIEKAARQLGRWRLLDCTLYVTLEPCPMCAGTLHQARIKNVIFGASDPKAGALGSLYNLHEDQRLNHQFPVIPGVLAIESSAVLRKFFRERRK